MQAFYQVQILLAISVLVAIVARRLHVPHSVGLVLAGVGGHLVAPQFELDVSRDLIVLILLPPLVFEAAYALLWKELRREMPVVMTFATGGLLASVAIVGAAMYACGWGFEAAAAFAVAISATDPVSVISVFRDAGVEGRTRILVEAESLFNDATAAILFVGVASHFVGGGTSLVGSALHLGEYVGVGLLSGCATALVALALAGRSHDHVVEVAITSLAAYGSFWIAERYGGSGILATVVAGMVVGNQKSAGTISERGHEAAETFWEYAAFLANSIVFLILGSRLPTQFAVGVPLLILVGATSTVAGRVFTTVLSSLVFHRSELKVSANDQKILIWGGMRGALAIALILSLPPEFPHRAELLTVTYAVVCISVVAQGITIGPLIRFLGRQQVSSSR